MSESIELPEGFYALLAAHNRDGETMEATLRRLVGGPEPEEVAGILSTETADQMRDRLDDRRSTGDQKADFSERFE